MRLWSIHPKYLDSIGLVALWRETLLAKKVLEGKTKGYKNHPQLIRFKNSKSSSSAINYYLSLIYDEAKSRGYNFNRNKFESVSSINKISITSGQLKYELSHLRNKLQIRDKEKLKEISNVKIPEQHPLFSVKEGNVEIWEKVG